MTHQRDSNTCLDLSTRWRRRAGEVWLVLEALKRHGLMDSAEGKPK